MTERGQTLAVRLHWVFWRIIYPTLRTGGYRSVFPTTFLKLSERL